jgi:hypothetical protein
MDGTPTIVELGQAEAVRWAAHRLARRCHLNDQVTRQVEIYAIHQFSRGASAARAIAAAGHFARVRAGLIGWPRPPQGAA